MNIQTFAYYRWLPSLLLVMLLYPLLVFFPNSFILDMGKDGQRAYFVFMHYMLDGQGYDFKYLNYPFGENLFYLDCDPLLLGCSKLLFTIIPFLQHYTVGFFNLVHMVPLILACYFLTRIFEELHVNRLFSVLFALLVGFLSPQWFKMAGNFSLSYVFYLPALIFLLLRWSKEGEWRYTGWIFVFITASYFSHPYLGLIHTAFVALVQIQWIITHRSLQTFRNVLQLIILAVVPVILFILMLQFTDTHFYRNPVAGGFGENYLGVYEWIIQGQGISARWLHKLFIKEQPEYFDNASVPFIFWALLFSSIFALRRIKNHTSFHLLLFTGWMLIPAFLLVIFATGVFGLTKFEWLYEWVYYAKQFRFVARFAWPFYYVLGILSLSAFYFIYEQYKKEWGNLSLMIVISVVCYGLVDVVFIHVPFHHKLTEHSNFYFAPQNDSLWSEAVQIQEKYLPAAVVSLPFSMEGSFRYASPFSDTSMINGYRLSWYTKLPLVGGILIRPSETETEAIRESFNLPIYTAPLATYFSSRSLLILADTLQLSGTEKQFLKRARYISSIRHYSYYLLTGDTWSKTSACDTVAKYSNMLLSLNDTQIIKQDLEDEPFDKPHRGKGVRTFRRGEGNVLFTIKPGMLPAGLYTASCWVYNRAENAVNGCFVVQSFTADGTFEGWITFSNPARSEIIHNGWSYTECNFELDPSKTYELFLIGYDFPSLYYTVDDVMIRKLNETVIEYNSFGKPVRYNSHQLICNER